MEKQAQLIHAQASQRHLHNSFTLARVTRHSGGHEYAPQVVPQPDKRENYPHAPKLRALPAQRDVPKEQEVRCC
jgi:hypothetical protein